MSTKAWLAWSGGKDSALALWRLQQQSDVEVVGLLTTFTTRYGRVQMHGTRRILIEAQADALGLPLHRVWLPVAAPNARYEAALRDALVPLQRAGGTAVVFGDLYLADIRAYRKKLLEPLGLKAIFPLWEEDTARLAQTIVAAGIRATVVCVDPKRASTSLLGRSFDEAFLSELPAGVDPCGENGEFHTFVGQAPNFAWPLVTLQGVQWEWLGHRCTDLTPVAQPLRRQA